MVRGTSKANGCGKAHHWVLGESVKLRGRQALLYPNSIGRRAVCKKCDLKKILPEQLN